MGLGQWPISMTVQTSVKFQVNTYSGCGDTTCTQNLNQDFKLNKGNTVIQSNSKLELWVLVSDLQL